MIFDIALYALAIAATLAFVSGNRPAQSTAGRHIHRTIETLHAIGEALPDNCFGVDTEATTVPDVDLPDYDELFAQADVIGDRHSEVESDDFSDLLAIASPRGIDTWLLAEMGTHALRTLGVIEGITGARRWTKAIALSTLQAHYAMA